MAILYLVVLYQLSHLPSIFNHFLFFGSFLTIQVQGILNFKMYISSLSLNYSLARSLFFFPFCSHISWKELYINSADQTLVTPLKMLLPRPSLNPMATFQFLFYLTFQQGLILTLLPETLSLAFRTPHTLIFLSLAAPSQGPLFLTTL